MITRDRHLSHITLLFTSIPQAAHDRLLSKAHQFCAQIAAKFPSVSPTGETTVPPPNVPVFTGSLAGKQPEGDMLVYNVPIDWQEGFKPGALYRFPPQPPVGAEIKFSIPSDIQTGQSFRLSISLTKPQPNDFALIGLAPVDPPSPSPSPTEPVIPDVIEVTAHDAINDPIAIAAQAKRDEEGRDSIASR